VWLVKEGNFSLGRNAALACDWNSSLSALATQYTILFFRALLKTIRNCLLLANPPPSYNTQLNSLSYQKRCWSRKSKHFYCPKRWCQTQKRINSTIYFVEKLLNLIIMFIIITVTVMDNNLFFYTLRNEVLLKKAVNYI